MIVPKSGRIGSEVFKMIQISPPKALCALTIAASVGYILLSFLLQETNLGSLGVVLLITLVCLAGFSRDEDKVCDIRTRRTIIITSALLLLISSIYMQALPYELLILYPLLIYFSVEDDQYSLLASIVLLFSVVTMFSGNLLMFGKDTTHHAIRAMEIIREGKLPVIRFVDHMYLYFPFYHLLHAILSEVSGISPAFPYAFSFLTYGVLGLILVPHLISKAIGGRFIPGFLLIGLPLIFVFVISPIPEAYSIVLCLLALLPFLKASLKESFATIVILYTMSFFYHPVPTLIFITIAVLLSLKYAPSDRRIKISLLLVSAVLLYISYSLDLIRKFLFMIEQIKLSVIKEVLALKVVAYSINLSNPVNSFLLLINYALIIALAMISLKRKNQLIIFLSSATFILLGAALSLSCYTAAFYRYFGTPVLFLLVILAGQGMRKLRCKSRLRVLALVLTVIFTSSFVIGALIPPSWPLSQETAYLYRGMPKKQDLESSSFLGKHVSNTIITDYRIEPAVSYYSASYDNILRVKSFSPRGNNFKILSHITEKGVTFIRKDALREMGIIRLSDSENLNNLIILRNIYYSSGKDVVTHP